MKAIFKLLEKTAGPIGLLVGTIGAILDFLTPLGSYVYGLIAVLLGLTILSALCSRNNLLVEKIKSFTSFAPDYIKSELVELWQPDSAVFWKKGLFQVLLFLTALSVCAAVYAQNNPKGFLATKIETVADLQSSLGLINSKLDDISVKQDKLIEGVDIVNKKLDLVKKETSNDPRKELSNLGVAWDSESFWDALIRNDLKVASLFIDGGFHVTSDDYYEGKLLNYIHKNGNPELLELLLLRGTIDKNLIKSKYSSYSVKQYNDLISKKLIEVNNKNGEIHRNLLKTTPVNEMADIGLPPHFDDMGITPLLCAIWEKNQKLVNVLIAFGADAGPIDVVGEAMYSKRKEFIKNYSILPTLEASKNGVRLKI